jgi:phospholipid transport system substrate-binding protein
MRLIVSLLSAICFCTLLAAMPAGAAADPAVTKVQQFQDTLLAVMKQNTDAETRFKKLAPKVDATFDLAAMTKFAVGPAWDSMSKDDQKSLIEAFRRMTIASYAHNFAKYSGEKFSVEPTVEERDADHLVHGEIVPADDKPVKLIYRMRSSGGKWKVIDVLLNGYVSELATRRSDFASTVQEGAPALVKKIDELSDKLMQD